MRATHFRARAVIPGAVILMIIAAAVGLFLFTWSPSSAQGGLPTDSSLTKPTALTANADGANVVLNWTAPLGQVDGYQVERRLQAKGASLTVLVNNTATDATTYTDSSITEAGTYAYRVRLVRNGSISKRSYAATASVTASAIEAASAPDATASTPAAPETEVERLTRVVKEVIGGCLAYEQASPSGSGTTYVTSSDDADCLPVRHIVLDTCVPGHRAHSIHDKFFTVERDDGSTKILTTFKSLESYTGQHSWQPINTGGSNSVNLYVNTFLTYIPGIDRMSYAWEPGYGGVYSPSAQQIDGSGDTLGVQGQALDQIIERMGQIGAGAAYRVPQNCAFNSVEEQDQINEFSSSNGIGAISIGTTTIGYLDNGPDLDLFQLDLTAGTEYQIYAYALPKQALDYAAVPLDTNAIRVRLGISTRTTIPTEELLNATGNVIPALRVLDADGDEVLALTDAETAASFTPPATDTYYVQVAHANEADYDNHGAYGVVAYSGDAHDYPASRLTHGRLYADNSLSSEISDGADVDWIRFDAEAHTIYNLNVAAHSIAGLPEFNPLVDGIYDINGNDVSDQYQTGNQTGTASAEIYFNEAGTYFVAIASQDDRYGEYTLDVHVDDYGAFYDWTIGSTSYADSVSFSGKISRSWDKDSFDIHIDNAAVNHFKVTAEPNANGNPPALRISFVDNDDDTNPVEVRIDDDDTEFYTDTVPDPEDLPVDQIIYTVRVTVESVEQMSDDQLPIAYTVNVSKMDTMPVTQSTPSDDRREGENK